MAKQPGPFREHLDIPADGHLAKESNSDPVAACRRWATAAIAGVAAVWLAWTAFGSAMAVYTPGPLSHAHAVWETSCASCHPAFIPISSHGWAGPLGSPNHAADANCQNCHEMPDHHESQKDRPQVPGCTDCHREHLGREASLRRVADGQCLNCHREPRGKFLGLTGVHDHPEFQRLREGTPDPGRLAFGHALHLTPGLRRTPDAKAFLGGDVAPGHPIQQKPGPKDPVKLVCADCHRLDAEVGGLQVAPARASGDAMLPISFDKHCWGCHPLTFDKVSLPHRLQPAGVREHLQAHFTARLLADGALPSFDTKRRLRPGDWVGEEAERKSARQQIDSLVSSVERMAHLSNKGCSLCHQYDRLPQTVRPAERASLRVLPPDVPQVWLPHARFSHAAHGQVTCRTCHEGAEASKTPSEVLLPSFDKCKTCHSPAAGPARGGVRHACVDCHSYHNGDHPLQGRGAAARQQGPKVDLETFFRPGR